jgi:formylglycine-generating enzyme
MANEQRTSATLTRAFLIRQTELTRREWMDLVGVDTGANPDHVCVAADCPITNVTWWDAIHLANALSAREGLESCYEPKGCSGTLGNGLSCEGVAEPDRSVQACLGYRLPTRAESEYAARAGTVSAFYTGQLETFADLTCQRGERLEAAAWYCDNSGLKVHPAGARVQNGFGLSDMLGNAGEWINDAETFASSPGGDDPEGSVGANERRVIYGGDVRSVPGLCRAANRSSMSWAERSWFTGFRLVRTLPD